MKITLDDVADYLEQFHKYDGYAVACCPFHDDNSPSLFISDNGYYCKAECGARGSLAKLYNHLSGRPVQVTKRVYNPSAFIWDRWIEQYGSIVSACTFAHNQLLDRPELGEYLYKRKLTQEQIEKGYLGFLSGYYIFPIKDFHGDIQGAVARASPTIQTKTNRYSSSKDCPVKLYVPDWDAVLKAKDVFVCFGTLDAWSLLMAGYPSITGISGQSILPEYFDEIRKPIWIIPDKNEERSALHLQRGLNWRGRRLNIHWPDGTKDMNDIHAKYGLEKIQDILKITKEEVFYD